MSHRKILIWLPLLLLWSAFSSAQAQTQKVPAVKLPYLQRYLSAKSDTTYIINFWATWCKPCIEELSNFETLQKQYANQPVKVLLVSLDFMKDLDKKVIPFVNRRQLKSTVFLLDEPDQNAWIDLIDPNWSGAIPATLFINPARGQRFFIEKPLTIQQLEEHLKTKFPSKS